ncbi:MAG: hypothetical protein Q9210_001184 [Variospora velana]
MIKRLDLHRGTVMRAEKANAFFGNFCQFEERDHLKASMSQETSEKRASVKNASTERKIGLPIPAMPMLEIYSEFNAVVDELGPYDILRGHTFLHPPHQCRQRVGRSIEWHPHIRYSAHLTECPARTP